MSKALDDCVCFANWCKREGFEPCDGAELIRLAKRCHAAGVRECNTGKGSTMPFSQFGNLANRLGLTVEWSGLWPTCLRNGVVVSVPDIA